MSGLEASSREELLALVVAQAGLIGQLQAQVTAQAEQLAVQAKRLAELERRLSRNSGNSGMPPSVDDLPGRVPPSDKPARGGGKRKPGKQPGAPGAYLAWSDDPDDTVAHFPAGACPCGRTLAGAADVGVAVSHQEHDIPAVTATVTQHDLHRVRCGCGREYTAPRPEGVADAPVSYGVNLRALCVYLMVVHAIPVHRCVELVESMTGAAPSAGWAHGLLARAWRALVEVDKRVRTLITLAHAVCADETPIRVGPGRKKRYLLVACTELYTWYMLGDRSLDTFKAFVLTEVSGVVVHDRYAVYDHPDLGNLVHQLCTAHLLRDLADAAQTYPDAHWPIQVADALRGLVHASNTARAAGHDRVDRAVTAELVDRYRHGVLVGLKEVPRVAGAKQPLFRLLLEVLRDRQDDVLRFVHDLRVPATSNQAERDLRPAKTQQKISGRLRSETVTRYRYRIRGYTSTAQKHGVKVLDAIRDALLGRPWTPPDPAPA